MSTRRSIAWVLIGFTILIAIWSARTEALTGMVKTLRRTIEFEGVEREYYIRLPTHYVPENVYWLLVTVHGGGGNGKSHFLANGVRRAADESELEAIVVSPSFSNRDRLASRFPSLGEGKFLQAVVADLRGQYRLQPKILLTGYSRGGQFSHRFAFRYPEWVEAVAPFAAGTWTTPEGGFLMEAVGEIRSASAFLSDPNNAALAPERLSDLFSPRVAAVAGIPAHPQAKQVPFLVMCGSLDPRFDIARSFAKSLEAAGYDVATEWPRTPHGSRDKDEFRAEFKRYSRSAVEFFLRVTEKD